MASRRMTTDEYLLRPAAVFGDMAVSPRECRGHVFDMLRMFHSRRKAIVDHYGADALPRPTQCQIAVKGSLLVAVHPRAAVHEQDNGILFPFCRQKEVKLVLASLRVLAGLQFAISNIAHDPHV